MSAHLTRMTSYWQLISTSTQPRHIPSGRAVLVHLPIFLEAWFFKLDSVAEKKKNRCDRECRRGCRNQTKEERTLRNGVEEVQQLPTE